MGLGGSKACSNESTMASSSERGRSRGNWVFQSSCLGTTSGSRQSHSDDLNKENCGDKSETESDELKIECDRKVKDGVPCISSNDELGEWGDASITSTTGSSSARSASTPSNFLSRFNFIGGNISFRLSRATGPSRAYTDEQDLRLGLGTTSNNFFDRMEAQNGNSTQCHQDTSSSFQDNLQENQTISSVRNAARDGDSNRVGVNGNVHCPRILNELENMGTRASDRRIGVREPVDRNVRFSRTLSVGRLRDRVLRRSSLSDVTFCPLQQETEVRDASQSGGDTRMPIPESNIDTLTTTSSYSPSTISSSLFSIQDQEVESSRSREARYRDLLEHRSNFLERRRRIRSQVRALQRLGSRFENLSGPERSCILSGQHRMGRCTCRVSNRDANSNDDTGTRSSISRIVMLAEALFEVLDEIHQQSVVLSTRPSVSSLGSIPAPNEVVESLPVKFYTKSQKYQNEEAVQCYICLVEYEEGDIVRILPCHHEFHRTCVDKWLKEIHRVCPLCRGDICKSDLLPSEN